ncbi:hypothetical protein EV426DRAFT_698797 [Tirmania nivea]|nr:hypothetical protein EV426DRAFT_698797 [Tirmania nivea]
MSYLLTMAPDARVPPTPPDTPDTQPGGPQPTLPADALAEKISALSIPSWGEDGSLPTTIAQDFPVTAQSLYTHHLLTLCWDTVLECADVSMSQQKRVRKAYGLLEAVHNRHDILIREVKGSIAGITADRDRVTAEKSYLEAQCKKWEEQCKRWEEQSKQWKEECKRLRGDIDRERSRVDRCQLSADYWKDRYNGNKSVLTAQGNAISRAAAWESEEVIHQPAMNWSTHTKLTRTQQTEVQKAVTILLRTTQQMAAEIDLYRPIDQFLSSLKFFNNRVNFLNTSQTKYLVRQAPDFSICIPRVTKPHPALVHGVIEVKKRGEDVDTAKHLGQLKEYMLNLMKSQCDQGRMYYWGFLTNMETNILVEITQHRHQDHLTRRIMQYPPMEWLEMVQYIYSTCQKDGWIPPKLHFRDTLGPLVDLIACNKKWQLGEFQLPLGGQAQGIVVKVSVGAQPEQSHRHELEVLRHIRNLGSQPASIVRLVWDPTEDGVGEHPEGRIEFGISPRGKRFSLDNFSKRTDADTVFQEIVDGIRWLHETARVIHRDIRRDNIILDKGHPIIIDFDCSYVLNSHPSDLADITTYAGGLICVPNDVIKTAITEIDIGGGGQVQTMTYKPKIEHDLFAFVILVISLLFPKQFEKFPVHRMSWRRVGRPQLEEMDRFHQECEASEVWGKWWLYAKQADYERLKAIGDVCQFPSG